ncbi:hypothetical protein CesoFtcFv8_012155 [Champsocephalus esox]|uniref:Uncharacterized protein n=1 Tax=Champsocephalus esox TaxID=159716 RepID=A0AAN8BX19_9TELE|nr:hypothetical protein CesoFtcFv8_012155 [Champsocephalus esox]
MLIRVSSQDTSTQGSGGSGFRTADLLLHLADQLHVQFPPRGGRARSASTSCFSFWRLVSRVVGLEEGPPAKAVRIEVAPIDANMQEVRILTLKSRHFVESSGTPSLQPLRGLQTQSCFSFDTFGPRILIDCKSFSSSGLFGCGKATFCSALPLSPRVLVRLFCSGDTGSSEGETRAAREAVPR